MFMVEGALSIFLAQPLRLREAEECVIHSDSNRRELVLTNEQAKMPELLLFADTLETALSRDLANVPEVRHVLTEWADRSLLIWIAIDNPEPNVRRRIYQKEMGIMTGFPEIEFDFNLIPSMGRRPEDLATGARVVYSRSE
ncbi:MAG: hypothetical protein ACLQKA_13245 [Bryobacteraceae bacterium]